MTSRGHSHLSFTFDGIKFSEEYQRGQPVLQQFQAFKIWKCFILIPLEVDKRKISLDLQKIGFSIHGGMIVVTVSPPLVH